MPGKLYPWMTIFGTNWALPKSMGLLTPVPWRVTSRALVKREFGVNLFSVMSLPAKENCSVFTILPLGVHVHLALALIPGMRKS